MTIDLSDVQGNVVRGYGLSFDRARHFALAIGDPAAARTFLGELVDGDTYDGVNVTSSAEWAPGHRPASCLNIGITWLGLQALGVDPAVLSAFPPAFIQGPAVRAQPATPPVPGDVGLGDVGDSAPDHWELGGPATPAVHLMLSVYTRGSARLDEVTVGVRRALADHALTELWHRDAQGLPSRGRPSGRVHFGYVDGIAQPRIAGAPGKQPALDLQPEMPTGDLLLGRDYSNSFGGNFAGEPAAGAGRQRHLRGVPDPAPERRRVRGPAAPMGGCRGRGPRARRGQAHGPLAQRRAARAVPAHRQARARRAARQAQRVRLRLARRAPRALRRQRRAPLPVRGARAAPEPARGARSWARRTAGASCAGACPTVPSSPTA